jgi:hypothetical protein
VARRLTAGELRRYELEYVRAENPSPPESPQIAEGVPSDLLWIFRRAWQTAHVTFSNPVSAVMSRAMEKGTEGYTATVITLIDKCFVSDGTAHYYDSILDVAALIQLEQYKIVAPIR